MPEPDNDFQTGAVTEGAGAAEAAAAPVAPPAPVEPEETLGSTVPEAAPKPPSEAELEAERRKAFEAQQMPTHTPSRQDLERQWQLQAELARNERIRSLSREHEVVAELVAENAALKQENAALKAELEALKKPKARR